MSAFWILFVGGKNQFLNQVTPFLAKARNTAVAAWSQVARTLARLESKHFETGGADTELSSPFNVNLRVALVKQTTYCDLYSNPQVGDAADMLASSWHRTGPIGLFSEFQSHFFIVRPEDDLECRIWEEKKKYWQGNPVREKDDLRRISAQASVAISACAYDWGQFDLVIALENAIPARITRAFPSVLWATAFEHHHMRPYKVSLLSPPSGYDAFLNLRYGPTIQSLVRRRHVIDWPYNFTAPGVLHRVLRRSPNRAPALFSALVEDHQSREVETELLKCGVHVVAGCRDRLQNYLEELLNVDVLVFPCSNRPLGGLAMLDAASAGVLLVGNPDQLWNPFLVVPELYVNSAKEAASLIKKLSVNPKACVRLRGQQDARLAWFGFRRPLEQIAALARAVPRDLTICRALV